MSKVDLERVRVVNPVPDPSAAITPTARALARERALTGAASPPSPRRHARASRRRRVGGPLIVSIAPLVLAAAALAASGLLSGAAYDPPWAHQRPDVGLGTPIPGGARLLPLRVADPHGGPPWGLRLVQTTRGYQCLQLGRVVDGQLGVLGQDGWFSNDHRFHPEPPGVLNSEACGLIGRAGYALAGTWTTTFASAIDTPGSCQYPAPGWALDPKLRVCPARDLRFVAFGLLGPNARAITYTIDGTRHTLPTTGTHGAYLVIHTAQRVLTVRGATGGGPGLAGGGGPGSFPGANAITYRDHRTCPSADPGPDTCVAQNPIDTPIATHLRRVAIHVTLSRARAQVPGAYMATVRFRAPITITSGALDYGYTATNPGVHNTAAGALNRNVARGATITWEIPIPACTRTATLAIHLNAATATTRADGLDAPAIATIATTTIHLPAVRRVPWC